MIDWPPRIVELVRVKEQIARLDTDGMFPYMLPSVAATADDVTQAESHMSLTLDPEHASFLRAANGWRAFFETQDLLSTAQLTGGEHRDAFRTWIDSAPTQARDEGYSSRTLLPIAVDLQMPLFAVMPIVETQVQKSVLSLDPSGIIDEFDSFTDYYASVIAYTKRNLADFESGVYLL